MAEVKVKVTAQNEVRTGLQQALQETKKFGEEAKRAVSQGTTIDPFKDDDRLGPLRDLQRQARELRELARAPVEASSIPPPVDDNFASTSQSGAAAIRGLAIDLANATSPAQVFEALIRRVSTAMGGLIAATAGFAIGSVIRRSLEDAAAGLNDLTDRGERLSQTLASLTAPTTSFQEFASTLNSVKTQIEGLQKATEDYKSSFSNIAVDFATQSGSIRDILANAVVPGGAITTRFIDRLRGEQGALFNQADANEESKRDEARLSIRAAIAQQLQNEIALSKQTTEEGRKQLANDQARVKQRKELEDLLKTLGASTQERGQRLSEFDRLSAQAPGREAADRERSLQAQADKQRAINEDNRRSLEERLQREKRGLADLEQFGGAGVGLLREQATARIDDLEKRITAEKERAAAVTQREAEQREQAARRAAQTLASALEDREFAGLSPAEKQAKIAADTAALIAGAESGAISPADAAQRALELQRREDALAGGAGGFAGSFGASALQRVGGASEEFFRVRPEENKEQKRSNAILEKILTALEKGEPLVLKGSQ
jgi:hypothetical protein